MTICLLLLFATAFALTPSELIDFLVEDECVNDRIDPSSEFCTTRRDIGGIAGYYRTDLTQSTAKHSFLRQTSSGELRIASTFEQLRDVVCVPPQGSNCRKTIFHERSTAGGDYVDGAEFFELSGWFLLIPHTFLGKQTICSIRQHIAYRSHVCKLDDNGGLLWRSRSFYFDIDQNADHRT